MAPFTGLRCAQCSTSTTRPPPLEPHATLPGREGGRGVDVIFEKGRKGGGGVLGVNHAIESGRRGGAKRIMVENQSRPRERKSASVQPWRDESVPSQGTGRPARIPLKRSLVDQRQEPSKRAVLHSFPPYVFHLSLFQPQNLKT